MDKQKLLEIYEEFSDKMNDIRVFIRNQYIGVRNIIKWSPVIYQDRQWDFTYLYDILRFKLNEMQKFFDSKQAISLDSEKRALQMRKCIRLIDKLSKDVYDEKYHRQLEQKWGELQWKFEPIEDRPGFNRLIMHRENIKTPEDEEQERKELLEGMKKAEKERQQDLEELFSIIKKNIHTWWD